MRIFPYNGIKAYIDVRNNDNYIWGIEYTIFTALKETYVAPVHYGKDWLKEHNITYKFDTFISIKKMSEESLIYFMTYEDLKSITEDKYNWIISKFSLIEKKAEVKKKLQNIKEDFQ